VTETEINFQGKQFEGDMKWGPQRESLQELSQLPSFDDTLPSNDNPLNGNFPSDDPQTSTLGLTDDQEQIAEQIANDYKGTGVSLGDIRQIIQYENEVHPGLRPDRLDSKIRNFLTSLTQDQMDEISANSLNVSDVYKLIDDHTNLDNTNAIQALIPPRDAPPGTTPRVIGDGQDGADIEFVDKNGKVVLRREIEAVRGNVNTFMNRVKEGAFRVRYDGNVHVQVPEGTDAGAWLEKLRYYNAADLDKYQKVMIIVANPTGKVLYDGPIVSRPQP
jgi:hypothetical protein